mmetsp:Transcript_30418/g.77428  ORF Transcript_30418/g.77428 Transcript_30418/m.77428 type:complete len:213 (-) Transcript_30418:38-676(-)
MLRSASPTILGAGRSTVGHAFWRDGDAKKPAPRPAARGRENGGGSSGSPSPCSSPRAAPGSPPSLLGAPVLGDITNMAAAILVDLGKGPAAAGKSPAKGLGLFGAAAAAPPQASSRGLPATPEERAAMLETALSAVRESLLAQGVLDSQWTNALATHLGRLPADRQLQEILVAHGWMGTQFGSPPDRHVLLADLARARAQATGKRRPRFGGA